MGSRYWTLSPSEAYSAPYAFDEQAQFLAEAESVLKEAHAAFAALDLKFGVEEQSVEKAIWMLQFDSLEALEDAVELLKARRHNTASRLYRDVYEALDIAAFFATRTPESAEKLVKWYADEILTHRVYRDGLVAAGNSADAAAASKEYRDLSRWAHRSYRVIRHSFGAGGPNAELLYHDSILRPLGGMPQAVSESMAVLARFILYFVRNVRESGVVDWEDLKSRFETLGE